MSNIKVGNKYKFVLPVGEVLDKLNNRPGGYRSLHLGITKRWIFLDDYYIEDCVIEILPSDTAFSFAIHGPNGSSRDFAARSIFDYLIKIGVFVPLTSTEKIGHEFGLI